MKYYVIDIEYSQTDRTTTIVYAGSKEKALNYLKNILNLKAISYSIVRECDNCLEYTPGIYTQY